MSLHDNNSQPCSHTFYVGQRVVCVDDLFNPERLLRMIECNMKTPVKGKVYTIREVVPCLDHDGILLKEIVNPFQQFKFEFCEPLYYDYRFRPLNDMEEMQEAEKEMEEVLVG